MVFSHDVVEREGLPAGEYYALTLFAISGMMLMAARDRPARDLPGARSAVARGLRADRLRSVERAGRRGGVQVLPARRVLERVLPLRHRVRVRASPARRGSTRSATRSSSQARPPTLALLAVGLLAVGFCFKVSAVPFHMWTPDALRRRADDRDGLHVHRRSRRRRSPRSCACSCRRSSRCRRQWDPGLSARSPRATMILGTVVGVLQSNIKRMLAYSSIAHAGYLLLGIVAANSGRQGGGPVLPAGLRRREPRRARHRGAARHARNVRTTSSATSRACGTRAPGLAGLMTVFLLSLGGFPPTAGFIGKWYIFSRRRAGRALLAGDHRRADERRLGLLLPAHRRHDV